MVHLWRLSHRCEDKPDPCHAARANLKVRSAAYQNTKPFSTHFICTRVWLFMVLEPQIPFAISNNNSTTAICLANLYTINTLHIVDNMLSDHARRVDLSPLSIATSCALVGQDILDSQKKLHYACEIAGHSRTTLADKCIIWCGLTFGKGSIASSQCVV